MTKPTPLHHPEDVCVCGDYRSQHKNGTGPCSFNRDQESGGDGHHGAGKCLKFSLFTRATPGDGDAR